MHELAQVLIHRKYISMTTELLGITEHNSNEIKIEIKEISEETGEAGYDITIEATSRVLWVLAK